MLMDVLGQPEDLLAAAGVVAGVFLLVVKWTQYWFPTELSAVEHIDDDAPRPTLRALLRNRYVVLILGFQMLSAVESQWLDFLVYDSASRRYADPSHLADFVSRFTAIAYGSDVLFLVVLAGILLHRFGLRYGLTANPGGVMTLVVAVVVAMAVQGNQATIVFVLIVGARVTDLVFSDAAARTSLGAAYQAVPDTTRPVAQATVEGLAVPVAIGVSGLVLLIVGTTVGTSRRRAPHPDGDGGLGLDRGRGPDVPRLSRQSPVDAPPPRPRPGGALRRRRQQSDRDRPAHRQRRPTRRSSRARHARGR